MAKENNLRRAFTPEEARENQKKSVEARKRNKLKNQSIAETVNRMLNAPVTDANQLAAIDAAGLPVSKSPTYRDYLVASIMLRTIAEGEMADLERLMKILGEKPIEGDSEALKRAKELLEGVDSAID